MNIKLYTDKEIFDITGYCTSVQVQIGLYAPYQNASVDVKVPLELIRDVLPHYEETAAIDLDTWIVISDHIEHEGVQRAIFLGRLTAVSYGVEADSAKESAGIISTPLISITAQSFIAPLIESQLYLSAKEQLRGHIYEVNSYGRLLKRAISSAFRNKTNVGRVLHTLYNKLSSPYRLPETLAGGRSLNAVPVIFSRERADQFAPLRSDLYRHVFGLALNASHVRPTGAPWSALTALFDADPSIIELFPSLEPKNTKGKISNALGSTPVIMYRLKPFIFKNPKPQEVDPDSPQVQEHARNVKTLITSSEIIRVGFSVKSADRINGVYVDTPLNASRGVDPFGILGRPTIDRDDVSRAGLRLYRGQWPFLPVGRNTKPESLTREIQHIISLVDQIARDQHRYINGTATTRQRLDINAGHWIKLEITGPHTHEYLICYVETITHRSTVFENSIIEKRSTISFTRGFYRTGEPEHGH
tara:strand:+ start:3204 stop:4625 length:1422 start_codon:yes stop_codon:yes gene_type:complete